MNDRVAIVTGASRASGIGAAIARELAVAGWNLLLTGWASYDVEQGLATVGSSHLADPAMMEELRGLGVAADVLECDLADPQSPDRVLEAAERLGPVTGLVNNATHSERTALDQLDAETLDRHYAINLRAPALLSRSFANRLHGGSGRIVNLTSGQGLTPMPGELAYAATKGGLEAFTSSLAAALAPRGITVNAIDPGATDTGWMSDEQRRMLAAPMGRLGEPRDAARLVRFLMSPEAGWITGQVIRSRGGL
ncbi:MAG: SDR family oxidoreductase [Trueperaceae bacterium]